MIVRGNPRRAKRLIHSIALTAVMALGATALLSRRASSDEANASSSAAPDAEKASTALDAGLEAHAAGDLTAATAKYEETLKYDPDNQFAFYNLALIDEAAGNYGLAEEKYRCSSSRRILRTYRRCSTWRSCARVLTERKP